MVALPLACATAKHLAKLPRIVGSIGFVRHLKMRFDEVMRMTENRGRPLLNVLFGQLIKLFPLLFRTFLFPTLFARTFSPHKRRHVTCENFAAQLVSAHVGKLDGR